MNAPWNPRYLAYARATGTPDPEACMARDRERWPGGVMAGFIVWIREQWAAWYVANGRKPDRPSCPAVLSPADHESFDRMIGDSTA